MKGKALYYLAKRNARYQNIEAMNCCVDYALQHKNLSALQKVSIKGSLVYGKIRPFIRRLYYKMFLKTKTQ